MIDAEFLFSQHSLGDFQECPRRFYLKYIAQQKWPLLEQPPDGMSPLIYREYLRKGAQLHQWIERYFLGVETSPASLAHEDEEMRTWWAHFLATDLSALPVQRLPELALVAPLGAFRLYARFDLLAHSGELGDALVVVDWKTLRGEHVAKHKFLAQRIQTRAYLYVLATAGAPYHGNEPLRPEQCVMRYWLANFPDAPWVEITYTQAEYERDRAELTNLIADIARRKTQAEFELTDTVRHCAACTYRTLCHRSGTAELDAGDADLRMSDLSEQQDLEY